MTECPDITVLEDGSDDPSVRAHLASCTGCRRLVELMEDRGDDCASIELLLAAEALDAADAARLERHLAGCSACRELSLLEEDGTSSSRYELGVEVGRGGMGRVFDARDRQLERQVAVKVLRAGSGRDAAARFRREALVTARLQHPSIVAVYEMGHLPGGEAYYAMRKIAGSTLDRALREADDPASRLSLLPNVLAAAEAVAYAHNEGVIHRDLKPSNIMIGPFGETSVLDWGVAKVIGDSEPEVAAAGPYRVADNADGLTRAGAVLGTPQYMSPEQARGEAVDARSDVYALGGILYCLLSGRPPYEGATSREVVEQVREGAPPAIDEVTPDAPRDLRAIVDQAMARDPSARYASAGELAEDLRRFQTGQLVSAQVYTLGQLARRWLRNHRGIVAVLSLSLAALVAVGVLAVRSIAVERDHARESRDTAVAQSARADALSLSLLEDQGRRELLDGRRDRALVFLSAAYEGGLDTPALRFLLADAMEEIDSQVSMIEGMGSSKAQFDHSGTRFIAAKPGKGGLYRVADGSLIRDLEDPGTMLHALSFTHDDRYVIAGAEDGVIRRYDLETGRIDRRIPAHRGPLRSLVVYPDGSRVATGGLNDGMVKIWTLPELELIHEQSDQEGGVSELRIAPDGRHLVTIGMGDTAFVYDARTGARVRELRGHQGRIISPGRLDSFSPDGKRIVFGDTHGTIKIWNIDTGEALVTLDGHPRAVVGVFDRQGKRIVVCDVEGHVYIADAATGTRISTLVGHAGAVLGARFLSDGSRVATTSVMDVSTRIWDPSSGSLIMRIDGLGSGAEHPDELFVIDDGANLRIRRPEAGRLLYAVEAPDAQWAWFAPTGQLVVRARDGASFRDGRTGALRMSLRNDDLAPLPPVVASDGSRRLVRGGGQIELLRGDGTLVRALGELGGEMTAAQFSPDSKQLMVAHPDRTLRSFDPGTGAQTGTQATAARVEAVVYAEDGTGFATQHDDQTVALWNARGELERTCVGLNVKRLEGLEVSPRGRWLIVKGTDRDAESVVLLVDANDCRQVANLTAAGAVRAAAKQFFSRDEHRLLAGGFVFDTATGKPLAYRPPTGLEDNVRLSADGTLVASPGEVGELRDAETGALVRSFDLAGPMWLLEFDPSGAFLYTSHFDGAARAWDVRTGRLLARLDGHRASATLHRNDMQAATSGVSVDPGGELIATFGGSNQVRVWHVALEQRSPSEIARLVEHHSRWRLEGSNLVAKQPGSMPGLSYEEFAASQEDQRRHRAPAEVLGCDERPNLRSLDNQTEAQLRIANASDRPIRLSWIDFKGAENPRYMVKPYEDRWEGTWTSHPFVIRDEGGACIAIVRGRPGGSEFVQR